MGTENAVDVQIEKAINTNIDESEINEKVNKIINKANVINDDDKIELLLKAISYIDLTSLKGGETFEDIKQLCQNAECKTLNANSNLKLEKPIHTAAVCVYPANAQDAIKSLKDLNLRDKIEVASVAADFPAAKLPLAERIKEIEEVVKYGVDEVDIVINRSLALAQEWQKLYDELKLIRKACGDKKMKTILATGDLPSLKDVYVASVVAMSAGTDFIKTSTGKEAVNAILPVGVVMCKAINDFYVSSGKKIGLKPAGGIKTAEDTLQWLTLINEELGEKWLTKDLFRIGASSVLDNIISKVQSLKS